MIDDPIIDVFVTKYGKVQTARARVCGGSCTDMIRIVDKDGMVKLDIFHKHEWYTDLIEAKKDVERRLHKKVQSAEKALERAKAAERDVSRLVPRPLGE